METSFLDEQEIQDLTEGLIAKVMKETKNIDVTLPFPRMTYDDAMNQYGSDKPDTRFEMLLTDVSTIVKRQISRFSQKHQSLRPLLPKMRRMLTRVKTLTN